MVKSDQPQPKQIEINATDEISKGRYSNLMMVSHSPDEFMLDWLINTPNGTQLVSRIIIAPGHAKRIIEALTVNVQQYEEKFGQIKVVDQDGQKIH